MASSQDPTRSGPESAPEGLPLGQVAYDNLGLWFLVGMIVTLVLYTIWGLINLASVPFGQ